MTCDNQTYYSRGCCFFLMIPMITVILIDLYIFDMYAGVSLGSASTITGCVIMGKTVLVGRMN